MEYQEMVKTPAKTCENISLPEYVIQSSRQA